MNLSPTLSFYLAKNFLKWLLVGLAACGFLVFLIDLVELIRKSSDLDVSLGFVLQLGFLRLPNFLLKILPFAILFGSILCFTKLTKTQELVIARASGVSVWQFTAPAILTCFIFGLFVVFAFNPIAAAMSSKATRLMDEYFEGKDSLITVSDSGLWLKQLDRRAGTETLITAASISGDGRNFSDIILFDFGSDNQFVRRIDAKKGKLNDNSWDFERVIINVPGQPPEKTRRFSLPTNLTLAQIQDSFSSPETISFWELPGFIEVLETSGFSALRHRLHLHSIMTTPVIFCAMVLIAAVFSLRFARKGKTGLMVAGGVLSGFIFFFATKLAASFGVAGSMPVFVAAWIPAVIFILVGIWLLLHLEDG